MMGQILVLYFGIAIVFCYFFRKYALDPPIEVVIDEGTGVHNPGSMLAPDEETPTPQK